MDATAPRVELRFRDFFWSHDWRWQQALELFELPSGERRTSTDSHVLDAVSFLHQLRRSGKHVKVSSQDGEVLEAAFAMHLDCGPRAWEVEARLLTGQADREIGQACGLAPDVVDLYAQLFFDVRDRLHSTYCISEVISSPGPPRRKLWLLAAAVCGLEVLEVVMAASDNRPWPQHYLDETADNPETREEMRLKVGLWLDAVKLPKELPPRQELGLQEATLEYKHANEQRRQTEARPPDLLDGLLTEVADLEIDVVTSSEARASRDTDGGKPAELIKAA